MNVSERINDVIGSHGIEWNIKLCDACYTLVPHTQECCVHPGLYHTFDKMSGIKVSKSCAICYCNIHGERVIESEMSLSIRSLFFIFKLRPVQVPNEDIIRNESYNVVSDCVYFIVSRHVVLKDQLYGKFGNHKFHRKKDRFSAYSTHNPSYIYASVSYNKKAINEHCGPEHEYLDNYIYSKIHENDLSIPMVYFKNTDWFEITQEISENILEYIREVNNNNNHPMLSNGQELEIFIQKICKYLEASNTIKSDHVNTCESCGSTKYTKLVCFQCSATSKEAYNYIHMFISFNNVFGSRHMYFVKQQGSIMFMEDFKEKFFNWLKRKHNNVKYTWTGDYSALRLKGYEVVRAKICKTCQQEAHRNCCSSYDKDNRSTRTIIRNIAYIEEER